MDEATETELSDLPPSAKLVFKVLEYNGPMTQKAIVEESMLSARTVRYALERLENVGVVDEDVYFADARQNLYELTHGAATADGGRIPEGTSSRQSTEESGDCPDAAICDD